MPEAMVLKSEGNGSNLYDPHGELTLKRYCEDIGLPYKDLGYPIPLSTFIDYGIAFQQRFVPRLEDRHVTEVDPTQYGYDIHLDDGEIARARHVIVAAGIRAYEYMPPELEKLPDGLASHSAMHVKVEPFAGKQVAVIGGGASAINLAAVLNKVGAEVTLVARRPAIAYCGPPRGTYAVGAAQGARIRPGHRLAILGLLRHARRIPRHAREVPPACCQQAPAGCPGMDVAASGRRHRANHCRCNDCPSG